MLVLVISVPIAAGGQTAYMDARYLAQFPQDATQLNTLIPLAKNDQERDHLTKFKNFVLKPGESSLTTAEIQSIRQILGTDEANDLMRAFIDDTVSTDLPPPGAIATSTAAVGLSAMVIEATTAFLVERVKAEASLYAQEQVVKALNKEYPVGPDTFRLRLVLPATYATLHKNPTDLISPQVGRSLRSSLREDLLQFPVNLDRHVFGDDLKSKDEYKMAYAVFFGATGLLNGRPPNTVLADIAWRFPTEPGGKFEAAVNVIYQLSEGLRDVNDSARLWISPEKLREMTVRQWELFVALVRWQDQAAFDRLELPVDFSDLANAGSAAHKFTVFVNKVATLLSAWNDQLNRLNASPANTPSRDSGNSWDPAGNTQAVAEVAKPQTDPSIAISFYANGMLSTVELAAQLVYFPSPTDMRDSAIYVHGLPAARDMVRIVLAVETRDYQGIVPPTLSLIERYKVDDDAVTQLMKFASFGADVASAESSKEMEEIIEKAVLPVGGYKKKRKVNPGFYFNAYVGFGGGIEYVDLQTNTDQWSGQIKAWAPIGLEYARGRFSFFVPVIDLGTLVSYRFQSDSVFVSTGDGDTVAVQDVSQSANASFAQVFAPGLFVGVQLFGPVALTVGAQLAPKLREVKTVVDTGQPTLITSDKTAVQFGAYLAFDIPLWRF
jgi:hypothetical protein